MLKKRNHSSTPANDAASASQHPETRLRPLDRRAHGFACRGRRSLNGRRRCTSAWLASRTRARTSARAERTRASPGAPPAKRVTRFLAHRLAGTPRPGRRQRRVKRRRRATSSGLALHCTPTALLAGGGSRRRIASARADPDERVSRPPRGGRAPPFMSQVHTWGDASLLALLLAADFTWLIADKEVNQVSLPLALVWSVFIAWVAFAERRANPDGCVVALTTALWCFGNGFWTLSDFAEWQDVAAPNAGSGYDGGGGVPDGAPLTYAGVDFYDIQTLDNLAGACFLIASLVGAAYYAHLRYTPFFYGREAPARRRARGRVRGGVRGRPRRALRGGRGGRGGLHARGGSRPRRAAARRPFVVVGRRRFSNLGILGSLPRPGVHAQFAARAVARGVRVAVALPVDREGPELVGRGRDGGRRAGRAHRMRQGGDGARRGGAHRAHRRRAGGGAPGPKKNAMQKTKNKPLGSLGSQTARW